MVAAAGGGGGHGGRADGLSGVLAALRVPVVHVVAGEAEGLIGAKQASHHGLGGATEVTYADRSGRGRRIGDDRPSRGHRLRPDQGRRRRRCWRGPDFLVVRLRGLFLGKMAAGARLLDLQCSTSHYLLHVQDEYGNGIKSLSVVSVLNIKIYRGKIGQ